jgi:GNAT superfamily N-acetyltransferase
MIEIRPLIPTDAAIVEEVFRGLGPRSRHQRFFTEKPRLTGAELDRLTRVDGHDHVAYVALADGRPIGVSRFVREAAEPETAEVAFAVVDDWQGRGIGRQLATRLYREAARLGVRRVRGFVLVGNRSALALIRRPGRVVDRRYDGGAVELLVEL